jgi:hypothetical protein
VGYLELDHMIGREVSFITRTEPFEHARPYVEPKWDRVRVRVLRPFYWHASEYVAGRERPLGPNRLLAVGEIIECIAPDASSLVALGRAEFAN